MPSKYSYIPGESYLKCQHKSTIKAPYLRSINIVYNGDTKTCDMNQPSSKGPSKQKYPQQKFRYRIIKTQYQSQRVILNVTINQTNFSKDRQTI